MAENHLADSEQALENALNPAPTTLEIQTKTIERMNRVQAQYDDLLKKHEELVHQLEVVQNRYDEISSSSFWKMTKPARAVLDTIKTGKPLFREKQPKEKLTQGKNVPISFLRVALRRLQTAVQSVLFPASWITTSFIWDSASMK